MTKSVITQANLASKGGGRSLNMQEQRSRPVKLQMWGVSSPRSFVACSEEVPPSQSLNDHNRSAEFSRFRSLRDGTNTQ
ncbi:MAG: hypothetical protein ACLQO7_07075 [Candidatus Bathyarchaeia archaeon]